MEFRQSCLRFTLTVIFGFSVLIFGIVPARAQIKDPLTFEMVMTGLKSKSSGASLGELNEFIKFRVNELGVDFPFNAGVEKDLHIAGATSSLIEVIRRKAPKAVDEKARAEAKIRRDNRDKEIADLTAAIEKNPKDAESLKKRAALYDLYADYHLALEDYVRALEVTPGDQTAKNRLNRILDDMEIFFITPVRRSDSPFERDAYVKGFISIGAVRLREMMLSPPFYRGGSDNTLKRKETVHILAFVNEKGRVVSASAVSNQFWLTDSAIKAAQSSSFFERKPSAGQTANEWVIIVYEYER